MLSGEYGFKDRVPIFWRLQIMGWGGIALFGLVARYSFRANFFQAAVLTALMEPTALLFSSCLRYVYKKVQLRSEISARTVTYLAVSCTIVATIETIFTEVANRALHMQIPDDRFIRGLALRQVYYCMIFGGWSVAYLWLKAEFRARTERELLREAAAASQRAELQMLRLQLNPHFMFNSLNNIATEIPENPDLAVEMTHRLAEYLRYSLDHRDALIVPLSYEVHAMTTYMAIEQERFGQRLSVSVETEPQAGIVQVPCFLLQPLVENAVKHGLNSSPPPLELKVRIWLDDERLCVEVKNTGRLDPSWKMKPAGTGLINLKRRLELHFPSRHRFSLRQRDDMVCSEVILEGTPCSV